MGQTRETAERLLRAVAQAKQAAAQGHDAAWTYYLNQMLEAARQIGAQFPEGLPDGYVVLERAGVYYLYSQDQQDYVYERAYPTRLLLRKSKPEIVTAARLDNMRALACQEREESQILPVARIPPP